MKHLLVGTVMIVLILVSVSIGCVCWLYEFRTDHFYSGSRFINTKVVVGFIDWMPLT